MQVLIYPLHDEYRQLQDQTLFCDIVEQIQTIRLKSWLLLPLISFDRKASRTASSFSLKASRYVKTSCFEDRELNIVSQYSTNGALM